MRKMINRILVAAIGFLFLSFNIVTAQDEHSEHNHGATTNKTQTMGKLITEKKVENYNLGYYLLNKKERNEAMKGMEGMEMPGMSDSPDVTNHLMIYIKGADGKNLSGKIGFKIIGPDGKEFKTMTMGMNGGYGADVILKNKGTYKIVTKAVIGDKAINDDIKYENGK